MKILLVVFEKKSQMGKYDLFRSFLMFLIGCGQN